MQRIIEMNKKTCNRIDRFLKFMAGVYLFGMAWVGLPDLVYINYTDITRECTTCSLR